MRVPEHSASLPELYIVRDYHASVFVRCRHDTVEQPCALDIDRYTAILDDGRRVWLRDVLECRLQPAVGGSGLKHQRLATSMERSLRYGRQSRRGPLGLFWTYGPDAFRLVLTRVKLIAIANAIC